MSIKPLHVLLPDDIGVIDHFKKDNFLQIRFVEMGLLPGMALRLIKKMPLQGTIEIKIRSFYMSLRWEDADRIMVRVDE